MTGTVTFHHSNLVVERVGLNLLRLVTGSKTQQVRHNNSESAIHERWNLSSSDRLYE